MFVNNFKNVAIINLTDKMNEVLKVEVCNFVYEEQEGFDCSNLMFCPEQKVIGECFTFS